MNESKLKIYKKEVPTMCARHGAESCSIKMWPKTIGKLTSFKFNAVIHVHSLAINKRYPGFVRTSLKYFSQYYKVLWISDENIQNQPFIDFISCTSLINLNNITFHEGSDLNIICQTINKSKDEFVFIDTVNQFDVSGTYNLHLLIKQNANKRFVFICRHNENKCLWNTISGYCNSLINVHINLYVNSELAYKIKK